MKLFIVNNVLSDHTSGMVVVRAESIEHARDICVKEWKYSNSEFQDLENYSEIDLNGGAGIVDVVYGGS